MKKNILLGTGSRIRGDDAAGSILAAEFSSDGWISIDGGSVPENYFSMIKRNSPALLVIVDACYMALTPGSMRRINISLLSDEQAFNTHSLPLNKFIGLLEEHAEKIIFIGIQPESVDISEEISIPVREAVEMLKKILQSGLINEIEEFH